MGSARSMGLLWWIRKRKLRHAVVIEDARDFPRAPRDEAVQLLLQLGVTLARGHRDAEGEAQRGRIFLRRDRRELERGCGVFGEVAREWSPGDGSIHFPARYRF